MLDTTKYEKWLLTSRILQIRYIAILTAILYCFAAPLDSLIVTTKQVALVHLFHLYVLPPILLIISGLSFFKKSYSKMIYLLLFAPAIAAIGNLLITSKIDNPNLYLPEMYLCIFWIFTISGLKLSHASISAGIVIFISSFSFFYLSYEAFLVHLFWIICATSFGFTGAYLLDRSNKKSFLHEEALVEMARTDKLTGLYNRAKFDEVLAYELSRNKRVHHPFGLALIDIDFFKLVNDNFGHHAGDDFLIEIAQLIQNNIRETDILMRWGGEEFALICLGTDLTGISTLMENIRKKVEQHHFVKVGKKTISAGVTIYRENDTQTTILTRADEALYLAKNSGRNCTKIVS